MRKNEKKADGLEEFQRVDERTVYAASGAYLCAGCLCRADGICPYDVGGYCCRGR